MSRLQCRGSIARAAVVVALVSSGPAGAQVVAPGPPRQPGGMGNALGTGVVYDVANQAMAERHLEKLQAKLRRDTERGDRDAVDRDVRRIDRHRFRVVVDEWLIRKNSLLDPGSYPYPIRLDPVSRAAIAETVRPPLVPDPPWPVQPPGSTAPAPTISITIANAEPAGADVAFAIDDVAHQAAGGSRQELAVAPDSIITYDGGGSIGRRRYRVAPGFYEFRSTPEGWVLYKLPGTP